MKISTAIYTALTIIIFIVFAFYEALRTKTKDVSKKNPFNDLIGANLTLKRDIILAKNLKEFYLEQIYFLTKDEELFEGVQKIEVIPKGTKITIESATFHTNGTSGSTTNNIVGTVLVKKLMKEIQFEYSWGSYNMICIEEPCDYWTFPLAVWQEKQDFKKYFIK